MLMPASMAARDAAANCPSASHCSQAWKVDALPVRLPERPHLRRGHVPERIRPVAEPPAALRAEMLRERLEGRVGLQDLAALAPERLEGGIAAPCAERVQSASRSGRFSAQAAS
jgi:hypothetical protein